MKNLFNQKDVDEIVARIDNLSPHSQKSWGKMNVSQMLAHCNKSIETAMGMNTIKPLLIGKIIGRFLKPKVLSDAPFGRNSPTDKSYLFNGEHDFDAEKSKIKASIKKFMEGGPSACTNEPHPFFGKFTPEQWAVFQWKHLDHHLRQFQV